MIISTTRAAKKRTIYWHFCHATFLATTMNTMIRQGRPGGGCGRMFDQTQPRVIARNEAISAHASHNP